MDKDRPVAKEDLKKTHPNDPPYDAEVKHPVGTATGAVAGGAAAGAALGSFAGPVGTAIGAAVATLAGAWAGREIAEQVNPDEEIRHWEGCYGNCAYVPPGAAFKDYGPAYRYGIESYRRGDYRIFEHAEPDLAAGWDTARGDSRLGWEEARPATRDAWERLRERADRAAAADDKGRR